MEKLDKTVYILEDVTPATYDEVEKIQPLEYENFDELVNHLAKKISCPFPTLKNQAIKAFVDCITEEHQKYEKNFDRLRLKAIYLIAWFSRYGRHLFKSKNIKELPVLLYFGVCQNSAESILLRFFSYLPVDIIIVNPNTNNKCRLIDKRLFEVKYNYFMELESFPTKIDEISHGTVAFHAEKELEEIMYKNSGMYKVRQHDDAISITLDTIYEEIAILWNNEARMRPNFQVINSTVIIPTIMGKVLGVKNGDLDKYWNDVYDLVDEDTIFIKNECFYYESVDKFDARYVIKDYKLDKRAIIENDNYKYGIFREETQKHIIDKLEELIESKIIRGTFENCVEYTIIDVIMNLDDSITRKIQSMDFTKKNPKLLLVNTTDKQYSLEESIIIAYLHFIGFDIVMFVPTGYRVLEQYYCKQLFTEHNIGEFMYDLKVPEGKKEDDGVFGKIASIFGFGG